MARIHELVELLKEAPDEVFVQPHNVPDPDAIASSFGLQQLLMKLGVPTAVVYEDEIEKANSVVMLTAFGIDMRHSADVHTLGAEDWTVLVDVQKDNSNLTDLITDEVACIDHHQYSGDKGYQYQDIRPDVGSCSAIIAEYYRDAGVEPSSDVATALVYGIFMDTDSLTRGVSSLDIDIVITITGVNVVVSYSIRDTGVKYSTRSVSPQVNAGGLVRHIVDGFGIGGGHDSMAGGFIGNEKVPDGRSVDTFTRHRAIEFVESVTKPST